MSVRPRTKPAEIRRTELLDAAERLFLANGVQATSVDAIVAAADVAKGTFYLYFPAKEAVLGAPDDFAGRLDAWVVAFTGDLIERSALHAIVFDTQIAPIDDQHENLTADLLADLLAAAHAAGTFTVDEPRLTALMLFHAAHGAVHEMHGKPAIARKRLIAALKRFFRCAVAPG